MKIDRSLRLPYNEYKQEQTKKSLIVLHHTAGGSARSTFNWWITDPKPIATAYIIERDGTIYEVFPPDCWAYHLKIGAVNERRSIGIEIASEGGLLHRGGKHYCFDRVSERTLFTGKVFDNGKLWRRQYRYFAAYTQAQFSSTRNLVDYLMTKFNIPPAVPTKFYSYDSKYKLFSGIIGHHHVRPDKTDVHPGFDWIVFINNLGLHRI